MKLILQIIFLLLIWFTNLANTTPVFSKVVLPSCDFVSFWNLYSKTGNILKNFGRSRESVWIANPNNRICEQIHLSSCVPRAMARGGKILVAYPYLDYFTKGMLASYSGILETFLCATEEDKVANAPAHIKFMSGYTNEMLSSVDIEEMGMAITKAIVEEIKKKIDCLDEFGRLQTTCQSCTSKEDVLKKIYDKELKCYTGFSSTEMKDLADAAAEYAASNYNNAYVQGKVTAFLITFAVPFLGELKILNTTKLLSKFKNLSGFTKLESLIPKLKGKNITQITKLIKEEKLLGSLNGLGDMMFGSAREFVRTKYGQSVLNQLTSKFGVVNDGAAAIILQKWGDDGLVILNKSTVTTLDEAANELLRGKTAYRHISSNVSYLEQLKISGKVPQNVNSTYFSLDKFDDPIVAIDKMQLNGNATDAIWRLEFDANQLVGKVTFPKGKWNNAEYIEVLTRSYPNFGSGGASQFITQSEITLRRMVNIKTGQIINF